MYYAAHWRRARVLHRLTWPGERSSRMILDSFYAADFQRYFDELLSRAPLLLFVHVPKTAGSSLNGELQPILSPGHHIFVDYTQLDRRPFNELLDEAVESFIERAKARRYRYCTGHIIASHVTRISEALPDVRPVTLLRDPVSRFVSDYRYQCSTMHPGHEQFRTAHPTIESYLELQGEWNKAAAHLVPDRLRGDTEASIGHIEASYAFVGIQEAYALSLRVLTTLAGAPRRPAVFRRVNTPTPETQVVLPADLEERIRQCNALDAAIYDHFAARFNNVAAGVSDYLDRIDPLPEA